MIFQRLNIILFFSDDKCIVAQEIFTSFFDKLYYYVFYILSCTQFDTTSISDILSKYYEILNLLVIETYIAIELSVKCGYPLDLPSGLVRDSTLVQGYVDPALVGTTVNISCPYGNVLSESDTTATTCTENAEWEPDPTGMRCRGN